MKKVYKDGFVPCNPASECSCVKYHDYEMIVDEPTAVLVDSEKTFGTLLGQIARGEFAPVIEAKIEDDEREIEYEYESEADDDYYDAIGDDNDY